ncbi:metallophosphoesterase family protein [Rhodococcoides corynebacterioides]|uniref:metallophosphoesterase family protein n=1 Tax=Rhodococcoides corynebacterioides TaxID=53972 RepID=UPI003F7CD9B4
MQVLLLADTHVPTRAKDLPAPVWDEVDRADLVIHAGDWMAVELYHALRERASDLMACWGNNDGDDLRALIPEVDRRTVEGVRVAVVHETGAKAGREKRADATYPDVDLLVFGHSHIPWDTVTERGMRLLNPGSPTDRRRQPACTYMTMRLADNGIHDVRLVSL